MSNQKTQDSFDAIKAAHDLDHNPERLNKYYAQWADRYDQDVRNENYIGPEYIVDYLGKVLEQYGIVVNKNHSEIDILDAGCGTGLVGIALRRKGYQHVDGFDLSPAMVDEAKKTGAYRKLVANGDITQMIPEFQDNAYPVTLCCGVFTTGHVPPSALNELIRITQPGGIILVTTRKSYYESSDFEPAYQALEQAKQIKLIDQVVDGPYLNEEGAHYWAFQVN